MGKRKNCQKIWESQGSCKFCIVFFHSDEFLHIQSLIHSSSEIFPILCIILFCAVLMKLSQTASLPKEMTSSWLGVVRISREIIMSRISLRISGKIWEFFPEVHGFFYKEPISRPISKSFFLSRNPCQLWLCMNEAGFQTP